MTNEIWRDVVGYRNKRFAFYSDYLYGCIPDYKGKHKRRASVTLWR